MIPKISDVLEKQMHRDGVDETVLLHLVTGVSVNL